MGKVPVFGTSTHTLDISQLGYVFLVVLCTQTEISQTVKLNTPGQNTEVGSCSLLQGIFPTQGSNPGLPHCRQILYQLSHKESPRILEWVAYPFSNRSFQPRNQTRVSCITGRLFTNWAMREGIGLSHYISIQIGQNQIDILPVRRCRWPKSTWKDDQRH